MKTKDFRVCPKCGKLKFGKEEFDKFGIAAVKDYFEKKHNQGKSCRCNTIFIPL